MIKVAVAIVFWSTLCSAATVRSYAFGAGAFPVAQGPTAIVSADFNHDGRTDLAVADGNGVSVLLGKPDGSFAAKVDYSFGTFAPTGLAVGDVNGDGKIDLIAVTPTEPTVWIGRHALAISAITTTGAYAETHTCGARLAVGSSCTISITFKPTSTGTQLGSLSVKDTAAVKPQTITLSGVGAK